MKMREGGIEKGVFKGYIGLESIWEMGCRRWGLVGGTAGAGSNIPARRSVP